MNELSKGLEALDIPFDQDTLFSLEKYTDQLILFNSILKLIADNDKDRIITRHILDCASAYHIFLRYTKEHDVIADLGSGAGLPGIVLALLLKDREFVLIERMQRRVGFLRGVSAKLMLQNVHIVDKDIKDIKEKYSVVTCRAFHPLNDISDECVRLLDVDAHALMYKGRKENISKELEELEEDFLFDSSLEKLNVPFLNEERYMCILSGWRKK